MDCVYHEYWQEKALTGEAPLINIVVSCNGSKTKTLNIDIHELTDIIEVINNKEVIENG